MAWICVVFFFSGFPALVYQLAWQRSLFTLYGVNIESVTVVVTAFMLGLGLGSLAGGAVTRIRRVPLLLVFSIVELAIGAFGFFSLALFRRLGALTLGASALETGVFSFLLVLLPTVLMGSTLPLLVAHLVRLSRNVGRSVGILYFVNTLGSAAACFAVASFIMGALGLDGAVRVATALNLAVSVGAFMAWVRTRRGDAAPVPAPGEARGGGALRMPLAILLVAVTGYIALSYEILWFRVYSFAAGGIAAAFALLLGTYLAGIAGGSLLARRFCREPEAGEGPLHLRALSVFVLVANLLGFLLVPAVANAVRVVPWYATLPFVGVAAAMLGAAFPLICHHGIRPDERAGAGTSYLYLANIVGSALGSLLTGFVLMDVWSIGGISLFLALMGVGLSAALLVPAELSGRRLTTRLAVAGAAALLALLLARPLFSAVYEKLQLKEEYASDTRFAHVVETRSGVITVAEDGRIFGGGVYDGVFSTDLVDDRNGIVRAFALGAFHPSPKRVLMIGLSSGSWAQVIAHHPGVKRLTIVEINPGYVGLLSRYPVVQSLLENVRVELIIDDGRRWLAATDRRFDAVVSNTTFHWRAHASNLLSVEFHELVREHLAEGGVLYLNATSSARVQRTSATVCRHAYRLANFMLASDRPIVFDRERWRDLLASYVIDGRPVLDLKDEAHRRRLEEVLSLVTRVVTSREFDPSVEPRESILGRTEGERLVTDDNMGTEWWK
jgi:spermidine synthase